MPMVGDDVDSISAAREWVRSAWGRVKAFSWGRLAAVVAVAAVVVWVWVRWPSPVAMWALLGPHVWALVVSFVALVLVIVLLRPSRAGTRAASRWALWGWPALAGTVVVVVLVGWGASTWLLAEADKAASTPEGLPDQAALATARIEAVKTALAVAAGTGAVFALLLAVRRQWHQESNADQVVHDATERRITDLYASAGEQLGHDKAAVRLAGLYALERLGQSSAEHRETILNLICGYLRMPYPVAHPSPNDEPPRPPEKQDRPLDVAQEYQVRVTAQRILVRHRQRTRPDLFWDTPSIDLAGANLERADLRGVDLTGARLSTAYLCGAKLGGARLGRANLAAADLRHADLAEADLTQASLVEANMREARLRSAILVKAKLRNVKLRDADLSDANLSGARLDRAHLTNASLGSADLAGAVLNGANLSDADLGSARLMHARLVGATLTGTILIHAQMQSANLTDANLSGADLSGADLTKANLAKADFTDANLSNAILVSVRFLSANFSGANLHGALLHGTDHDSANFTGATGLSDTTGPDEA